MKIFKDDKHMGPGFVVMGRRSYDFLKENGLAAPNPTSGSLRSVRFEATSEEAEKVLEVMSEMEKCPEIISVAKSLLHRIDFGEKDVAELWVTSNIDGVLVRGHFKLKGVTEDNWEKYRGYIISKVIPVLYENKDNKFVSDDWVLF